jgi:hypothetical protein
MLGVVREQFEKGQLLREAPIGCATTARTSGRILESAVSASAGCSVLAMRDGAAYNTYRVYPHSRIITPLFAGLLELLPRS